MLRNVITLVLINTPCVEIKQHPHLQRLVIKCCIRDKSTKIKTRHSGAGLQIF